MKIFLPLNNFVKALITVLLVLIPVSLFDYAMKLAKGEKEVVAQFDDLKEIINKQSCWQKIWNSSVYFYIAIIAVVVVGVVISIW